MIEPENPAAVGIRQLPCCRAPQPLWLPGVVLG